MKIHGENKLEIIEISAVEAETDYYPSYRLQINVETEEVKASFDRSIWITETDLEEFISNLIELEKNRDKDVVLNSMSPGEFQLRFRNLDLLGHLVVELQLEKKDYNKQGNSSLVKLEFEIDPTSLPSIIGELKNLSIIKQC